MVFFQIFLADGPGLCSLVFVLCPQYDPSTSMAFPLRLYCVPKATPRRSSAIQLRLCYVLCVLTATLRRLLRPYYDAAATMATPTDLTRTQQECRVSATVLCMFKIFADGLRPCASLGSSLRPRCVPAASMTTVLRPGS